MTEEFETMETETKTPSTEAMQEALSTRELMEKNWDRFVTEETSDEAVESEELSQSKINEISSEPPEFDALGYLNESFEGLKETLSSRGISNTKEWIHSLVELEKLYQQSPKEVICQLAQKAGFRLPKKEEAVDILSDYAMRHHIPHEKMIAALQNQPQNSFPLQKKSMPLALSGQEESVGDPSSKVPLQKMIQEAIQDYFKNQSAETKKAKNSSFSPQGVGLKASSETAYTSSGQPKTTRQILEEGWRLLGL